MPYLLKRSRIYTFLSAFILGAAITQIACAQIQISKFGTSLFILGTAGDENVGILNWSALGTDIEIRNYNVQPAQSLYFSNVENIYIDLLEGNNVVQCPGWAVGVYTTLVGNLEIQTRQGDDMFFLSYIIVGGNLVIDADDGDNFFRYGQCHISGDLNITSGSGQDVMNWGLGAENANGEILGNMLLKTGGEIDGIEFRRFTLYGELYVDTGDGNDIFKLSETTFGDIEFIGGLGNDSFSSDSENTGNFLSVSSGSGVDTITIIDLFLTSSLDIGSGSQGDIISLIDVELPGTLKLAAGAHSDNVSLSSISVNNLIIDLSAGNDTLSLTNCQTTESELTGGTGTDNGSTVNSLLGTPAVIAGFETGNLN